ncbi:MAG: hypothetical protein LUE23_04335 [Lachnospiraceae bacterium]|nr:hypothetical protein [Lachnospiraceae bacterium]
MTNDQIAAAVRSVYNEWWLRWRNARTPADADRATEEGIEIIRRYEAAPLVVHMVNELVNTLSARVEPEKAAGIEARKWRIMEKALAEHQRKEAAGEKGETEE